MFSPRIFPYCVDFLIIFDRTLERRLGVFIQEAERITIDGERCKLAPKLALALYYYSLYRLAFVCRWRETNESFVIIIHDALENNLEMGCSTVNEKPVVRGMIDLLSRHSAE